MTKEKYKEYIKNTRDSVLNGIAGFHELGNVLETLSDYINVCIDMWDRFVTYDEIMERKEKFGPAETDYEKYFTDTFREKGLSYRELWSFRYLAMLRLDHPAARKPAAFSLPTSVGPAVANV